MSDQPDVLVRIHLHLRTITRLAGKCGVPLSECYRRKKVTRMVRPTSKNGQSLPFLTLALVSPQLPFT